MKINPVGINTYQNHSAQNQERKTIIEQEPQKTAAPAKVNIPQKSEGGSRLAVKAEAGSYADMLSTEERSALELLFSRYTDRERFGPAYKRDASEQDKNSHLGKVIDLKV